MISNMKNKYIFLSGAFLFLAVIVFYFFISPFRTQEITVDEHGKRHPEKQKDVTKPRV